MNILSIFLSKNLRIYLFAFIFNLSVFSLIVVPPLQQARAASKVSHQLNNYLASTNNSNNKVTAPISGSLDSIEIDRLKIDLPVSPGYYNFSSSKWSLDSKHVFTNNLTNPDPIVSTNQKNVLMIYGHDKPGLLADTSKLVYGDILTINTINGYQFRYFYSRDKKVTPTDSSILHEKYAGDPIILVTCTGIFYQFRHVMYFHYLDMAKLSTAKNDMGSTI